MLGTLALAGALTIAAVAQTPAAKPKPGLLTVSFPPSVYEFKDGPNVGTARANCLTCHTAEYVYVQPAFTAAVWTAEVNKMRNAYKANIADGDVQPIVDYLMSQNGKPSS